MIEGFAWSVAVETLKTRANAFSVSIMMTKRAIIGNLRRRWKRTLMAI
jgi:hypothetical protein